MAHYLEVYGDRVAFKKYWAPTIVEKTNNDESHLANRLLALLKESMKLHLMSKVPLGVYLSRGIESSTIVSLMKEFVEETKTFSVGFGGYGEDELKFANTVAEQYGTDHHEIIVEPDAVKLIPTILWHFEESTTDFATIPIYLLSENAKKRCPCNICGRR